MIEPASRPPLARCSDCPTGKVRPCLSSRFPLAKSAVTFSSRMTPTETRHILGLEPDEDPRLHLRKWRRKHRAAILVWLIIILLGGAATGWFFHAKQQEDAQLKTLARIATLEREDRKSVV